ncbi:hypothetical protein GALL_300610 [mine drainage metagenome]|uniref:Uncharacterized protein n=1 Tax=mine drainage metagenome TaxID=410659 RepID=A0A1J5QWJ4_9ZZZZ
MPHGNITASICIVFIAFAILKQDFFSVKVVATEFIVFALWLFVFILKLLVVTATEPFVNGGLLFVLLIVGVLTFLVFLPNTQKLAQLGGYRFPVIDRQGANASYE